MKLLYKDSKAQIPSLRLIGRGGGDARAVDELALGGGRHMGARRRRYGRQRHMDGDG